MDLGKDEIVRDDFPTARKGWDPDAVRAHLERLADRIGSQKAAGAVAERVSGIVSAAEDAAAGIEADGRKAAAGMREDAERALADARAEAAEIVARSKREAEASVELAQETVDRLLGQAKELRGRIDGLGDTLADEIRGRVAGITGGEAKDPAGAGEAQSPTAAEPPPIERAEPAATEAASELDPAGETRPEAEPEPAATEPEPEPAAEDQPEPRPEPAAETRPEPEPEPAGEAPPEPEQSQGGTSTDDLIAQLRGAGDGAAAEAKEDPVAAEPSATGGPDQGAARLVAMNMALEGAEREAIAARLAEEFDGLDDLGGLVDEVLERAGRS
jgi:hypothetical protein